MRFPLLFIGSCLLALMFGKCSTSPGKKDIVSQFNGVLPQIMQNDSGMLHGIELGMSLPDVKKHALKGDSLSQEEKDYLLFEGKLSPGQYYTYECDFDEKGLENITVDVYLTNEKTASPLLEDFKKYFTTKYGPVKDSVNSAGYFTWLTNEGKRPAKISVTSDPGYIYGKLSVNFYDRSFDMSMPVTDSLGKHDTLHP